MLSILADLEREAEDDLADWTSKQVDSHEKSKRAVHRALVSDHPSRRALS